MFITHTDGHVANLIKYVELKKKPRVMATNF